MKPTPKRRGATHGILRGLLVLDWGVPGVRLISVPLGAPETSGIDERSVTLPGPYFSGQLPSLCGHYYPDVLRLRDERRPDGRFVRVIDCTYCGKYELQLDAQTLDKELVRKLNKKGCDVAIRDGEVAEARKRYLEKLSSKANGRKRSYLELQSIVVLS